MPVILVTRAFRMADALQASMKRDKTEFAPRRLNVAALASPQKARDVFADFPTDEELQDAITTELPDNHLHRMARCVVRTASKHGKQLTDQGLTKAQLAALTGHTEMFDTAIDAAAEVGEDRDIQTQERIRQGNALFERVTRYTSVGKSLFENVDEARYNAYVIQNAPVVAPAGS